MRPTARGPKHRFDPVAVRAAPRHCLLATATLYRYDSEFATGRRIPALATWPRWRRANRGTAWSPVGRAFGPDAVWCDEGPTGMKPIETLVVGTP